MQQSICIHLHGALLFSKVSKANLPAAHVENSLLEPDRLMGHKAYGYILELLGGLLTNYTLVFTTLAQGPRWHCEHWRIPFSLVLIVSVAVAIAVFFQLKKMSRSARQVCLHPSHTRWISETLQLHSNWISFDVYSVRILRWHFVGHDEGVNLTHLWTGVFVRWWSLWLCLEDSVRHQR